MEHNKKTEVTEITPEELLSRVKTILEKTIKEAIEPKPEEYVGVTEVAKFCDESPRWVYARVSEKFFPYVKTGRNGSLKFKISEVAKVMEQYRTYAPSSIVNYSIDKDGNISYGNSSNK